MAFVKVKAHRMTEQELREMWQREYCDLSKPIFTFDEIHVSFNENMFNHAFFESCDRKKGDKSILSLNRLEKMLWIKETLSCPTAIIKQGWNKKKSKYENHRRVSLIKNNYLVIIRLIGYKKASFITAYELQNSSNIEKIIASPDWVKDSKYV